VEEQLIQYTFSKGASLNLKGTAKPGRLETTTFSMDRTQRMMVKRLDVWSESHEEFPVRNYMSR